MKKATGARQAKEIQSRISRRIALWEAGQHTGMVGDTEAKVAAREGRVEWE